MFWLITLPVAALMVGFLLGMETARRILRQEWPFDR